MSITHGDRLKYGSLLQNCTLCPNKCGVNRLSGQKGKCMMEGPLVVAGRAALHLWEEPCISGERGSGTIFFSGCTMKCVYCQNHSLSHKGEGKAVSIERIAEVMLELQEQGAANINLVTPTHYVVHIINALDIAKKNGLKIPVVYNTSGYERVETLKLLEGYVDIYLTDWKYYHPPTARDYSGVEDYPFVVDKALEEMVRQQPEAIFNKEGMMEKGVIVRHLQLPGHQMDAIMILRTIYEKWGDRVYISIMQQYTPVTYNEKINKFPNLTETVFPSAYDNIVSAARRMGIKNAYIQETGTAEESFIPDFTGYGIERKDDINEN